MKKIFLVVALLFMGVNAMAQQNKWHESRFERAELFAEMAAEEFKLNEIQKAELYEKKLAHFEAQFDANKKFKKGEINEKQKKAVNNEFSAYFNKLTGKTYQELKPFYNKYGKAIKKKS